MSASYIGSFLMGQQLTALQVALDAEKAKTATLETWASDRVKYVYPNGGIEGDEKLLVLDSIYTVLSPFPVGRKFSAKPEYFSDSLGEWVESKGMIYAQQSDGGYGVSAYSMSSGVVFVNTGRNALGTISRDGGGPENEGSGYYISKKWRVCCVRED